MIKNRLIPTLALAGATSLAAMLTPVAAKAVTYTVNRSWTDGTNNASLVGTVAVPLGNYTLVEGDSSPFTNVNLTLTVNSSSLFTLDSSLSYIVRSGKFFINATSSELTFNTAGTGDVGSDPNFAYLDFVDSNYSSDYQYRIGSYNNSDEIAVTDLYASVYGSVSFPVTFGTVQTVQQVPEPSTILGLGVVLGAIPVLKKKDVKSNKKKDGDS